jgi:hypothetical protein
MWKGNAVKMHNHSAQKINHPNAQKAKRPLSKGKRPFNEPPVGLEPTTL